MRCSSKRRLKSPHIFFSNKDPYQCHVLLPISRPNPSGCGIGKCRSHVGRRSDVALGPQTLIFFTISVLKPPYSDGIKLYIMCIIYIYIYIIIYVLYASWTITTQNTYVSYWNLILLAMIWLFPAAVAFPNWVGCATHLWTSPSFEVQFFGRRWRRGQWIIQAKNTWWNFSFSGPIGFPSVLKQPFHCWFCAKSFGWTENRWEVSTESTSDDGRFLKVSRSESG